MDHVGLMKLAIIIAGWAVTYGRLIQKIKHLEDEVKALRHWGESEFTKQDDYLDKHYVTNDKFNECTSEIKRRLDEVNVIELNSRLARIEAMLEQLISEK